MSLEDIGNQIAVKCAEVGDTCDSRQVMMNDRVIDILTQLNSLHQLAKTNEEQLDDALSSIRRLELEVEELKEKNNSIDQECAMLQEDKASVEEINEIVEDYVDNNFTDYVDNNLSEWAESNLKHSIEKRLVDYWSDLSKRLDKISKLLMCGGD